MSSSMFIENNSVHKDAENYLPNSNLVVVYGKSGISFDERGLDNLIEEKKISSISVVRLTSPTPSMKEEEMETTKLEEMLRRQELSSDEASDQDANNSEIYQEKNDSGTETTVSNNEENDGRVSFEDSEGDLDSNDEKVREKIKMKKKPRRRGRIPNALKLKQMRSKPKKKDRPEVIGLHVEEFYPPDEAHEIIKEALKKAGVNSAKINNEDYQFQLLVIQNDHCYTPFTSPTQMKAKMAADKANAEKQLNIRKAGCTMSTSVSFMKKSQASVVSGKQLHMLGIKETLNKIKSRIEMDKKEKQYSAEDEFVLHKEDVQKTNNGSGFGDDLLEEETLLIGTDDSAETDNDRDSDLDFDVNNRNGRKRKVKIIRNVKRSISNNKMQTKIKRPQFVHEEMDEAAPKSRQFIQIFARQKASQLPFADATRATIVRSTPTKVTQILSCTTSSMKTAGTKSMETKILTNPTRANTNAAPTNNNVIHSTPFQSIQLASTGKGDKTYSTPSKHSSQAHREIVIHKILTTPKSKGFTDLKQLFDQPEKSAIIEGDASIGKPLPTLMKATPDLPLKKSPTKTFMPLAIGPAAQHKLPSQISIGAITKSSKLGNGSDRQLDLLDAFVNKELQKPAKNSTSYDKDSKNNVKETEENIIKNNSIPELVKMLRSTEQTIQSQSSDLNINRLPVNIKDNCNVAQNVDERGHTSLNDEKVTALLTSAEINSISSTAVRTNPVHNIDISNAPLLGSSDGELSDDTLQDVVELIGHDKSLQTIMDKQVFGNGEFIPSLTESGSLINAVTQDAQPLTTISHESNNCTDYLKEPSITPYDSIIQLNISNVATSPNHTCSVSQNIIQSPGMKSSPVTRKDPVQIIRNNGRVITLPPVEAPITRAKRRAQTQPTTVLSLNNTGSESSLDSPLQITTSISTPATNIQSLEKKSISQQQSRRRSSASGSSVIANQKIQNRRRSSKKTVTAKQAHKLEGAESDVDDDDDPAKLWCICRQPHNNRFMICCDECQDWFHGTCVNISKAMGLEMEQKGIDWTCPKCISKQQQKLKIFHNQPKISEHLKPNQTSLTTISSIVSTAVSTTKSISMADKNGQKIEVSNSAIGENCKKNRIVVTKIISTTTTTTATNTTTTTGGYDSTGVGGGGAKDTFCIVCKKTARSNSIYCSDDCIRKHAQTALNTFMVKTSTPDVDGQLYVNGSAISNGNGYGCSMGTSWSSSSKIISIEDKVKKKNKGLFEDLLSMADRKPKPERVNVFERKSGRILTGASAPTTSNLKKWLQENPTFEVVQPGSAQALDIERKHKQKLAGLPMVKISGSNNTSVSTVTATAALMATTTTLTATVGAIAPLEQKRQISTEEMDGRVGSSQGKPVKRIIDYVKASSSSPSPRPGTPKDTLKSDKLPCLKTLPDEGRSTANITHSGNIKEKHSKRSTDSNNSNSGVTNKAASEPIRLNVRRTLKEQLMLRYKEHLDGASHEKALINLTNMPKLTMEELEEFAKATELEMYNYFNKDTGAKYRAKYRSLIFNIKDRKNHTLFAKICGKLLEPKQLVRMSPEEMASQELAQWRENETKHQLEIIKKSELDLLSCSKNYVLKTHKGEEMIEEKSSAITLRTTIPEEINIPSLPKISANLDSSDTSKNDLNVQKVSNRKDHVQALSLKAARDVYSPQLSHSDDEKHKTTESGKQKKKETTHEFEREGDYVNRTSSKERHRDKSRSHKRISSKSRSRSRSRGRERERHFKSGYKDGSTEKRNHDHSTKHYHKDQYERDKKISHCSSSSSSKTVSGNRDKQRDATSCSNKSFNKTLHQQQTSKRNDVTSLGAFSLIDQILESTKTVEQAANLVVDRKTSISSKTSNTSNTNIQQAISSTTVTPTQSHIVQMNINNTNDYDNVQINNERDQEPTSTVFIPTPPQDPYARFTYENSPTFSGKSNHYNTPIWTGIINMIDVASFQIIIQALLGNHTNIDKLLPIELEVVGRISPDTVWDYIAKIKKSPNKEIIIVLLLPSNESETTAYTVLYQYLENRNRLGVLKTTSSHIKDFYIYPLGCGKSIPMILTSTETDTFFDDPYRPDILLGIIIRVISKRSHQTITTNINAQSGICNKFVGKSNIADLQTSPDSPKILKKQKLSAVPKVDEIDVDAIIKAPIVAKNQKSIAPSTSTVTDADEPYSPRSSDEDLPLMPIKIAPINSADTKATKDDELKRKMDEINRQIAAQEMEIAGLLDPTSFASTSGNTNVLANISIPSNLSQILASIKPALTSTENTHLEIAPPPPPLIGSLIKQSSINAAIPSKEIIRNNVEPFGQPYNKIESATAIEANEKPSRLAQLTEAELLSMVPDDIIIHPIKDQYNAKEPPSPGV